MTTPPIPWTPTSDDFDDLWDHSPWAEQQPNAVPDILETMFQQQQKLMGIYGEANGHQPHVTPDPHEWGDLDKRNVQASIREFASYTVEELYEAINNLKNKPWKQSDQPTNVDAFKEELADMWHFLIEMHIIAGVNPVEIFRIYFRKAFINEHRVESGY